MCWSCSPCSVTIEWPMAVAETSGAIECGTRATVGMDMFDAVSFECGLFFLREGPASADAAAATLECLLFIFFLGRGVAVEEGLGSLKTK